MKETFTDNLIDVWEKEINRFPKLEIYSMVKECFQCAPYLINNCDFKSRQALSRLRTSSHNLRIEVGRYLGQRRDQRICTICQNGDYEDEFHFIMKCSEYKEIRDGTFKKLDNCICMNGPTVLMRK